MHYLNPEVYAGIDLSRLNGPLPVHLTNDYLFRAVMQENNRALKALVCALLHLDEKEVRSVVIQNPIELGRHIDKKDFFLDIKVLLNNRMIVNLEMQVINEKDWVERSQCYLCRSFDGLNKGEDYRNVRPAAQIGILDYTLFPEAPEFYATYRLMNVKTHKIFSDKLLLAVLDLKQIELASEEDKAFQLDGWARLFKSTTWKEMMDLAKQNPIFAEVAQTAVVLSEDEKIRLQCEAREDYYRRTAWRDRLEMQQAQELEQNAQKISQQAQEISQLTSEISRLRGLLESMGVADSQKS